MLKFIKPFKGCKQGDIYPTQFTEGEECPPELEDAAIDAGVVAAEKPTRKTKAEVNGNPDA